MDRSSHIAQICSKQSHPQLDGRTTAQRRISTQNPEHSFSMCFSGLKWNVVLLQQHSTSLACWRRRLCNRSLCPP